MQSELLVADLNAVVFGGEPRPLNLKGVQQAFLLAIAHVDDAATAAGVRTFFIGYQDDVPKYLDNFEYASAVPGTAASLALFPEYLALLLDNEVMLNSEASYEDDDEDDADGDVDEDVVKYISEVSVWLEDEVAVALGDENVRRAIVESVRRSQIPRSNSVEEVLTFIECALA